MILLGIDLETTGLDITTCGVIEVGAVLWDTGANQILRSYSTLVRTEQAIPSEVTKLAGISQEMVERFGTQWNTVL